MSNTTDLMEMAESLLEINEPETVEETEEATLEEGTELEETSEEEADDVEAETDEAEEAEAEEAEADDTEDDTEEDDGDEEPALHDFKVDGETQWATLEDLKRYASGHKFIQKGMEENALARKEVEQAQQTLQAEYQRFAEFAKQVQEQGLQPEPQRPDPAMARTDPLGYVEAQAQYETELNAYNAQKAEIDRMKAQDSERQAQTQQAYMAEQVKRLQERVPEFSTPESAAEIKGELVKVGTEHYGFSADEMAMLSDSRSVEVLVDALKYRKLIAGKAQAKKKPPAPRNVKPKAKRVNVKAQERQKQKAQAIKSGKIDDFVDLMIAG